MSWVRLLYTDPVMHIHISGAISDPFSIYFRELDRGDPMPLLFTLAIEPLREDATFSGLPLCQLEERMLLYVALMTCF